MAERYCDGCGESVDDDDVVFGYQRVPMPGGGHGMGPLRRFHPVCLERLSRVYRRFDETRFDARRDTPGD